ncbi:hypothetical protein COLO4_18672 [Corchorus olitorius]|uniref:Uncharacterized protein n=1 Tax=Corchorus olitorius TaxID=93759 RepID=A0A1R3J8A2_9ROSI|nr:hypothetical protein COLO4_18672 [Corchorus olitorius]
MEKIEIEKVRRRVIRMRKLGGISASANHTLRLLV